MSSNNLIKGTVIDQRDNPINNAVILLQKGPGVHQDIAILTNDKGSFEICDLNSGSYELLIRNDNYEPKVLAAQTNDIFEDHLIIQLKDRE